MKFLKSVKAVSAVTAVVLPKDLDVNSPYSIRNVAATIAYDAMGYYSGNTSTVSINVGDLQDPYYWWVAGALWGTMLDYYHYTGDPSYNDVVIQALLHPTNLGPDLNYVPPQHAFEEGNDDLFFWGSAVLAAAERNFPQPKKSLPSWLKLAANVFDSLASRWDTSKCGGGELWQIYASNPNGLTYKNSVSNGGFFQLAARLARATGNDTYTDWAEKIWDWSFDVGLIDNDNYHIYDGTDISDNCTSVNHQSFTYTSGIYLYGAAVLANYTKKEEWTNRTTKLLDGAGWFFSPYKNATDIMYQPACEPTNNCDADMTTQKAYLSRFMWQSTQMVSSLLPKVKELLTATAKAAAKSCTGGSADRTCGEKWYVGGYDGNKGLGQEMNALETIQGLLIGNSTPPLRAEEIKVVRVAKWKALDEGTPDPTQSAKSSEAASHTSEPAPGPTSGTSPSKRSGGTRTAELGLPWLLSAITLAMVTWGLA